MTALEFIQQNAAREGLEFLVIGGLAVIEHGYARLTTDIDLAVRSRAKESWRRLLAGGGYQLVNDGGSFQQYERSDTGSWPLDLMLVGDSTFTGLADASLPATVMSAVVPLVSLDHLLALKLHVLKQGRLNRFLDDLNDVVELVRVNRIDLESPRYRDLFVRYGTKDLLDKIQRLARAK